MKKLFYIFVLFLFYLSTGVAQVSITLPQADENFKKSYPIDGTYILESQNQVVYDYFRDNPLPVNAQQLRKTVDLGYTVGMAKAFYAYDFETSTRYSTNFTCRAVGTDCYIFVEDGIWNTYVNQAGVDSVKKAFDSSTPANPSKGIYAMDTTAFGQPPNVDGDPRIVILILDIKDGYSGSGGYVAGYFDSYNEMTSASYPSSNKGECYYIDGNPLNLTTQSGLETGMSTTAHEFQHMINWNYHQSSPQTTFINESCSMLAELNAGYPQYNQSLYLDETNHYLLDWRYGDNTNVLNDYSRAQKFALYLWNQFGIGIYKYIVQSSAYNGIPLYEYSLQQIGSSLTFNDVFTNWLIANELNDQSYNPSYGYNYPDIQTVNPTTYYNPNATGGTSVDRLGADYFSFALGSNLKIKFSTVSTSLVVKAIKTGPGVTDVVNVPLNSEFSVPDFGTTYSNVTFVVINTNQSVNQNYTFTSTGVATSTAQELKWDTAEPLGTFTLTTMDTVAVQFDAYPGARLDSIKVALRNAGSIVGGVWESTGKVQPTPLGNKLAGPFTASIATTSPYPYPVPYQNWATVDLRSYSISTEKDFVVGFVIGKTPSVPGVMVTGEPNPGPYHSFTYLQAADGVTTPNWYYYTKGTDSVWVYLIRAYVSVITSTGEEKVVELTPSNFSLGQNYPNPFNPNTNIQYSIGSRQFVSLKVYNLLGNEVATLVNKEQQAGTYNVPFTMSNLNLSSGTYFYRLQAGNFVETKKMILLK